MRFVGWELPFNDKALRVDSVPRETGQNLLAHLGHAQILGLEKQPPFGHSQQHTRPASHHLVRDLVQVVETAKRDIPLVRGRQRRNFDRQSGGEKQMYVSGKRQGVSVN